MFMRCS